MATKGVFCSEAKAKAYSDILHPRAMAAMAQLIPFATRRNELMQARLELRSRRANTHIEIDFLPDDTVIVGTKLRVKDARSGNFNGADIPKALLRQWIQGTGPATRPGANLEKSLRNVAYALLSGADGWMFDGEDALGQINSMSLDNIRNLLLALSRDAKFLKVAEAVSLEMNEWSKAFLGRTIVEDWRAQLDFTTMLYRARGLHLDDRHFLFDGQPAPASLVDLALYLANCGELLVTAAKPIALYLPKIQTATEAALWNDALDTLEQHFGWPGGSIKTYVLIEQLEATFQLMEIRAALTHHFVGFNTGRWDYINSVADALAWDGTAVNPNIEAITMTFPYMQAYEDRVRRAVNTPDREGRSALWQGGMEPNIPVGSPKGVELAMAKAVAGAKREREAGASGKWVAHWKMVHIVRPVWAEHGELNQLGRNFPRLTYTGADRQALTTVTDGPRTLDGARDLISVALQYGNAFLSGYQAAALKPADHFGNDDVLYLMEDMATGEIRVSILWEWLHKSAVLTAADDRYPKRAGEVFDVTVFRTLLEQEFAKLLAAGSTDVHEHTKTTTLPVVKAIVSRLVESPEKAPWYVDLLNLNIGVQDTKTALQRLDTYFRELTQEKRRLTKNVDFL